MAKNRITRGTALLGSLIVGGGTTVKKVQSGTFTLDPADLAAATKAGTTFTLTGAKAGDIVVVEPPSALEDDLVPAGSVVTADDTVTVFLYNASGISVNGASRTWRYLWIDLT